MHNDSLVRGTIAMTMKIMRMMAQTVRVVLYISLSFADIQRTDIMALDDAAIPDPPSDDEVDTSDLSAERIQAPSRLC